MMALPVMSCFYCLSHLILLLRCSQSNLLKQYSLLGQHWFMIKAVRGCCITPARASSSFYTHWYNGPQRQEGDDLCGAAFFGIQKKYENIHEDSCTNKKCTGCEITNTHEKTITLNLRGLCKDTYLDTQYAINYDPKNIITYIGIERNVISYDFVNKMWKITVK